MISLTRGAVIHEIESTKKLGGWVQILLSNGTKGYTKNSFLGTCYDHPSSLQEDEFRQNLLETAKSYLGTQYRWGGKTPFLHWYNNKRIKMSLGGMSPVQYRLSLGISP